MCRNIKQLRHPEGPPADDEISLAALQFVRKVSGYRKPSRANQPAFDAAVVEISLAVRRLFDSLEVNHHSAAGTHPETVVPFPTSDMK